MTRTVKIAKGVIALALLAGLVGGVPWALWHYVGWPLARHIPSWSQFTTALDTHGIPDQTLLKGLACVVWIAWAILAASVLVELPAALQGRTARRLGVAGPIQPLVGHLVAAVIVAALAIAPQAGPTVPRPLGTTVGLGHPRLPVAITLVADVQPAAVVPVVKAVPNGSAPTTATDASPATSAYVVQRNDTLWGIAERELGDPLRWSEIYALNEGRQEPGGMTLDDPNWIYPGWTLVLPLPAEAPTSIAPVSTAPSSTAPVHTSTPLPTTPPATTALPGGAASTTHTPSSAGRADRRQTAPSGWLALSSGSRLGAAFAAGVLSALLAMRLRRRRTYCPQTPAAGRCLDPPKHEAALRDLITAARAANQRDEDIEEYEPPPLKPLSHLPDSEALIRPDVIEVASRDQDCLRMGLCDWPGLTLCGPGAEAVLRAWLAAVVTRNGPYGAEILMTSVLNERLTDGVTLPSVHVVNSHEEVLSRLEAAIIGRTRLLNDADIPDAVAYRQKFPEDPCPLVLAIVDAGGSAAEDRLERADLPMRRLGIATIALRSNDTESAGFEAPVVIVKEDGTLQRVQPSPLAQQLNGARLFQLATSEASELLAPVVAVHIDAEAVADEPDLVLDDSDEDLSVSGAHDQMPEATAMPLARDRSWPRLPKPAERTPPIQVSVLGPRRVVAFGELVESGLRSSAYELLAWYLLRPEGASAEAAIEALWPNDSAQRGKEHFWTALGNLRSRLRSLGEEGIDVLVKVGDHYCPDPDLIDADLWAFEDALVEAAKATEASQTTIALERAVDAYVSDFLPTADGLWVEPAREDLHRRALDACVRLTELYIVDGRIDAAIAVLERAIEIDPICEDAYRRLMSLQVRLGHYDSAQRTWRLLQGRLAELDLEPETTTTELVHEVMARRPAAPPGRPLQAR
jgi:DNA-binding SARP family transcriptional activator